MFDLNIYHYQPQELIQLFDLPSSYSHNDLIQQKKKLDKYVSTHTMLDERTREKTLAFLSKVYQQLKQNIEMETESRVFHTNSTALTTLTPLINTTVNEHMVQTRENVKELYVSSMPSPYYSGTLNPLKKRTIRQFLNIDTRFRENYLNATSSSSNFHLDLPLRFQSVVSMQLTAFEAPHSFYTISKQCGNNYFWLNNHCVIVPDGNYTNNDLYSYLNSLLEPLFFYVKINNTAIGNSGSGQFYIASLYNPNYPNTNVSTSSLPKEGINFTLDFRKNLHGNIDNINTLSSKLGWLLGFRNGLYENNNQYLSEGIVDLFGSRYFYLSVNDYQNSVNNGFYSAFSQSILQKDILARISMNPTINTNSNTFGLISQSDFLITTQPREYFGPITLQKMHIQLLDERGRPLNMNYMDYSFCLAFDILYDL